MIVLALALAALLLSAGLAFAPVRSARWPARVGGGGAVLGGALAAGLGMWVLASGESVRAAWSWSVPFGSLRIAVDPLAAVFLIVIGVVGGLAAVYGRGYLAGEPAGQRLRVHWCAFDVLLAGMMLVVVAANGVLFLVGWEVMSLAAFVLVTFEDREHEVREAGWTYLVATHIGTAFLLALFVLLGHGGSLDFESFTALPPHLAGVAFVIAVIGFGAKAGFMPLHVWLPEAHPAAPSHVSAVLSAVMLKTGIYGLLRVLGFLGEPPLWWGMVLVGIGVTSGVLGVLYAIAQHDLKRLLAYHSVENLGIIALGLGCGLLGVASGRPTMAALGFAGALFHVVNHALFKGLLFLGAGAVLHATGTREIDHLGGLGKRMPVTAGTFLVGAAAISGLPPLNGFVSELLIFLAAFSVVGAGTAVVALASAAVLVALAMIGGLAAACFTKAFGVVFLGEPRGPHAEHAHDPVLAMRAPMLSLGAMCALLGLLGWVVAPALGTVALQVVPHAAGVEWAIGSGVARLLLAVSLVGLALVLLVVAALALRARLLRARKVGSSPTWDCGYAAPSARMQYTASSFAQPIVSLFSGVLRTRRAANEPRGLFPSQARLATHAPDVAEVAWYRPAFAFLGRASARLHVLQQGHVQLYVLYIAATLLALLGWLAWEQW